MWPWLPLNSCLKGQGPGLEAGNDIITSWGEVGTDKKQNQTKQKTKNMWKLKLFKMSNKPAKITQQMRKNNGKKGKNKKQKTSLFMK